MSDVPRSINNSRSSQRAARVALAIVWAAAACGFARPVHAQGIRITYFEPLTAIGPAESTDKQAQAQQPQAQGMSLSFDAFGRRFDLQLERNSRLEQGWSRAGGGSADVIPYQGTVVGLAESWVRLTSNRGALSGALWDGTTLYGIEQYDRVAPRIDTPSSAAAGTTIIYRWSDTIGRLGDIVGGVSPIAGAKPEDMTAALSAPTSPSKQVDIGVVADAELAASSGANTQALLLSIMNVVDGIFSSQVGVHLNVANIAVEQAEPDPFSSSDPSTLLRQVADYKGSTPALGALGLVHLFTGRTLVSTGGTAGEHIVGVANLGALCDARFAVGLTQATDVLQPGLVAAHEIGHTFGAPHDAESGSVCAATPNTFLMNATLNGSTQFSDCSLQQIQRVVASATCVTTLAPNDVSVRLGALPAQLLAGQGVDGTITVENTGPSDTFAVQVSVVATGVGLNASEGSSCGNAGPGALTCTIDRLGSGTTQAISFNVNSAAPGKATIDVHVTSANDTDPTNNDASAAIDVVSAPAPASSGGGGGGAADPFGLVTLLAMLIARRAGRRYVAEARSGSRAPHID